MNKPDPVPDTQPANELSLSNAVRLAPCSQITYIVEHALDARESKSVSTASRQQFEEAVKASGISPPKFEQRPHRAPKPHLLPPVCEQIVLSDQLAGAVLRIWAESERDLRVSVEEYAKANDIPVEGPDFKNRQFRDLMPLKAWNAAITGILNDSKDSPSPYEVSIMLCMVTGSLPRLIGQANPAAGRTDGDPPFDMWLDELKTSLASRAGPDAALQFVTAASKIVEDRREEEERISKLMADSTLLRHQFMRELVFLGIELPANLSEPRRILAGRAERLDDALNIIEKLETALRAFRDATNANYATWELRDKGLTKEMEAVGEVRSLIKELHDVLPEPIAPPEPEVEPEPQADDTTAELDALRAKYQYLNAENSALKEKSFNDDLYVASLRDGNKNKTAPPGSTPVGNVRDALELAREQFGQKGLLIHLNSISNPYTEFERPAEVFDALNWLATTYRDGRVNGGMADPAHSLKSVCSGWKYAPDNSDMAMSQYPEAYSTKGGGKTYDLGCHIGTGVANEEKHTIRIAFDWDDEHNKVVVGYIGKHQPNNF